MAKPGDQKKKTDDLPTCENDRPPGAEQGQTCRLPEGTQPAEERGERVETGRTIARGGKTAGRVPGATEKRP
jgi:hypothetical protein